MIRKNIKTRAEKCIKLGYTYLYLKHIYKTFEAHRDAVRAYERKVAAASHISACFNVYMDKLSGPTKRLVSK